MSFDSPSVGGYTFKNPPKPMNLKWVAVEQKMPLADGSLKQRILGYKFEASLQWKEGWIRQEDLTGIMAVANDTTATLKFIPRPATAPTTSYEVIWKNKFDFTFYQGRFSVYEGSMELQSAFTADTIGGRFVSNFLPLIDTDEQGIITTDDLEIDVRISV